jgi:transketolase
MLCIVPSQKKHSHAHKDTSPVHACSLTQNTHHTHTIHTGAPLGAEETAATRKNLGWEFGEFDVPQDALAIFRQVCRKLA